MEDKNQLTSQGIVLGSQSFKIPNKMCDGCLVGKKPGTLFKACLPMRSSNVLGVEIHMCVDLLRRSL